MVASYTLKCAKLITSFPKYASLANRMDNFGIFYSFNRFGYLSTTAWGVIKEPLSIGRNNVFSFIDMRVAVFEVVCLVGAVGILFGVVGPKGVMGLTALLLPVDCGVEVEALGVTFSMFYHKILVIQSSLII